MVFGPYIKTSKKDEKLDLDKLKGFLEKSNFTSWNLTPNLTPRVIKNPSYPNSIINNLSVEWPMKASSSKIFYAQPVYHKNEDDEGVTIWI